MNRQKLEVSLKAKNGIDFILAASIIWIILSFVWLLENSNYDKSIITLIMAGLLLPLAFIFSKILKTAWKIKHNTLQPLGLRLNLAQLFYFPFLFFFLFRDPEHFIMAYAVITGAHLFPYAWFYNENLYGFAAGIISLGALLLTFFNVDSYLIPVLTASILMCLFVGLFFSFFKKYTTKIQAHL